MSVDAAKISEPEYKKPDNEAAREKPFDNRDFEGTTPPSEDWGDDDVLQSDPRRQDTSSIYRQTLAQDSLTGKHMTYEDMMNERDQALRRSDLTLTAIKEKNKVLQLRAQFENERPLMNIPVDYSPIRDSAYPAKEGDGGTQANCNMALCPEEEKAREAEAQVVNGQHSAADTADAALKAFEALTNGNTNDR